MTKIEAKHKWRELEKKTEDILADAKLNNPIANGPISSARLREAYSHLRSLEAMMVFRFSFGTDPLELQANTMEAIQLWTMALERHNEQHASCVLYDCSTGEPRKEDRVTRKALYWC